MNPVYSQESEIGLLKTLLLFWNDGVINRVSNLLKPEHFYEPANALLYSAFLRLKDLDEDNVNVLAWLLDEVRTNDSLRQRMDTSYVIGLMEPTGNLNIDYVDYYAKKILKKYYSRKIQSNASMLAEHPEIENRSELIGELDIYNKAIPGKTREIISLKDAMEQDVILEGYETGFKRLDDILVKIHKQEYFAIGGRPANGKTSFALNLATNFAKKGIPVIYFSLEMSAYFLMNRIIAAESRIPYKKIIYKKLTDVEQKHYNSIKEMISEYPIFFEADPKTHISEIEKIVKDFKVDNDEFVPIIDYMQLVRTFEGRTREQEVAGISRQIKRLTMELNIPIIVLSQLSRKVDNRGKEAEPLLSDFRESGAIEQDCDIALFLHREPKHIHDNNDCEEIKLLIQKRRNGATGKVILSFHKNYTKFDNFVEMDEPYIP